MKRIAAIDLGSNAVRFVIAEIDDDGKLAILKKFREPVRLGKDVFTLGVITPETEKKAITAFLKFRRFIDKFDVKQVRAIATSATRDAQNGEHFAAHIREKTGIRLEVIDGIEEAHLVHLAVQHEIDLNNKRAVLIDIGGGSVEVTYSEGDRLSASQSFKMGAVRLLEELKKRNLPEAQIPEVLADFVQPLKHFLLAQKSKEALDFAVGTGGNFDALGRVKLQLLGATPNTYLERSELKQIGKKLLKLNFEEKMAQLDLRKDRADVIFPAVAITEMIMDDAGVDRIMIPYVGLKDGILWQAYKDLNES